MYFTRGITVNGVTFAENMKATMGSYTFVLVTIKLHYYFNDRTGRKVSAVLANLNTRTF